MPKKTLCVVTKRLNGSVLISQKNKNMEIDYSGKYKDLVALLQKLDPEVYVRVGQNDRRSFVMECKTTRGEMAAILDGFKPDLALTMKTSCEENPSEDMEMTSKPAKLFYWLNWEQGLPISKENPGSPKIFKFKLVSPIFFELKVGSLVRFLNLKLPDAFADCVLKFEEGALISPSETPLDKVIDRLVGIPIVTQEGRVEPDAKKQKTDEDKLYIFGVKLDDNYKIDSEIVESIEKVAMKFGFKTFEPLNGFQDSTKFIFQVKADFDLTLKKKADFSYMLLFCHGRITGIF